MAGLLGPLGEALPLCPRSPFTLSFNSTALLRQENFCGRKGEKYSSEIEKSCQAAFAAQRGWPRRYAGRAPGPQGRSPPRGSATCPLLTGRLDGLLQKFRMLMASTSACYKLFREKQKEGHGEAIMFKGERPRFLAASRAPRGACGSTGPVSTRSRTPSSTSGCPAHSRAVGSPWWEGAPASVGLAVVTRTSSRPPPLTTIDPWLVALRDLVCDTSDISSPEES